VCLIVPFFSFLQGYDLRQESAKLCSRRHFNVKIANDGRVCREKTLLFTTHERWYGVTVGSNLCDWYDAPRHDATFPLRRPLHPSPYGTCRERPHHVHLPVRALHISNAIEGDFYIIPGPAIVPVFSASPYRNYSGTTAVFSSTFRNAQLKCPIFFLSEDFRFLFTALLLPSHALVLSLVSKYSSTARIAMRENSMFR